MPNGQLAPRQGMPPTVGTQHGDWWWDGQRWVCNCDQDFDDCRPPFGFPPVVSPPLGQPPWYPGANGGVSFGSQAPPNPVRGHFWWDGTTLHMWDGAAWVDISAGGPVSQVEPQFRVDLAASITTYTPNQWNNVAFSGSPSFDAQGGFDPLLHRWTPKISGTYLFIMNVFCVSTAGAAAIAVGMNDNGQVNNLGVPVCLQEQATPGVAGGWLNCSGAATMRANVDYVRAFFYIQGTGGNVAAGSFLEAFFL